MWPNISDLEMLSIFKKDELLKLFFHHIKNLWRVDGLYFLGIEAEYGTKAATKIDANCWKIMGKIEARGLREIAKHSMNDIKSLLDVLQLTSWALYQTEKEVESTPNEGIFRVNRCRTQETRIEKGLGEFPCKQVRYGYLKSFTKEFNSKIEVKCQYCPPDIHPKNKWCEWKFILKR